MNPKAYIFFGKSGAGKGTQAKLLLDSLGTESLHVETGAGFRKFMEDDNHTSKRVKDFLDDGKLLDEFLPIWLWTDFLIKNFSGQESLIFDGVARRMAEAPILDGALDFYGIEERYIIFLDVSDEWAKERLRGRERYDDSEENIESKMVWYRENVAPVIEYFRNDEKYKFLDIEGEQAIEEVHQSIIDAIKD